MAAALPIILGIAGLAASGVQTGLALTSGGGGGGQPSTPTATTPTSTGPSTDSLKAAITPQALNIESLTGGSVSPDYLSSIAPILAGAAGQPNTSAAMQQVIQQILGGGSSTSQGSNTPAATTFSPTGLPVNLSALASTPGLSDYLTKVGAVGA